MTRTLHEILMDLHTIPSKTKGDTPMERIANAEAEIEQYVLKARKEELERIRIYNNQRMNEISAQEISERIVQLNKELGEE